MCDLEAIGATSILRVMRSPVALATPGMLPTFDLRCEENTTRQTLNSTSVHTESTSVNGKHKRRIITKSILEIKRFISELIPKKDV